MSTLPQELVDKVIDELACLNADPVGFIAPYATISKAWVDRTQHHVFKLVDLHGSTGSLEKWCKKIKPGPVGVSRHTRFLMLQEIKTLKKIEAHISAFIRIERLEIYDCNFLLSSVGECFTPMASSLTEVIINNSPTTLGVITSLLAALPRLKHLAVEDSKLTVRTDRPSPPPTIPFFQGRNSLRLRYTNFNDDYEFDQGDLDWIPDSARFEELEIDPTHFMGMPAFINRLFFNSRKTLTALAMVGNPQPCYAHLFPSLEPLACSALVKLKVSMGLRRPGSATEAVLSSITSSKLSVISLEWDVDGERDEKPEIKYSAWGVVENHLLRLAELFSSGDPKKKMRVNFSCSCNSKSYRNHLLEQVGSKKFLPKLREKVDFSLVDLRDDK